MNTTTEKKEPYRPVTYARSKIFVKHIWGKFQKLRWATFIFFSTIFFVLPWIKLNGKQAILFDIPARKFHILNVTLWPQEVYLLTFTLIIGAIFLFFSSSLVGRVWCGYMCPQTVFTSVFIEIERFVLGDSIRQKKLAKMPWGPEKIFKLTIRNTIWIVISALIGFTFMSYFVPNAELFDLILKGELSGWALFWFMFITGFAMFDFGFFREQFCFVPCPYGRFQGVLKDKNSLEVTYDKEKGEGKNGEKPACINCNYCVIVCPTGIDIRNGSQFECINCARCIDACAVVQIKQKRSPDLIRYDSHNGMNGEKTQIIRPRVIIYFILMSLIASFILFKIATRKGFDFEVIKNRNFISQKLPNGKIINIYSLKILNMSEEDQEYKVKLKNIDGELVLGNDAIAVKSGAVHDLGVTVLANENNFTQKINKFSFVLQKIDPNKIIEIEEDTNFVLPN